MERTTRWHEVTTHYCYVPCARCARELFLTWHSNMSRCPNGCLGIVCTDVFPVTFHRMCRRIRSTVRVVWHTAKAEQFPKSIVPMCILPFWHLCDMPYYRNVTIKCAWTERVLAVAQVKLVH